MKKIYHIIIFLAAMLPVIGCQQEPIREVYLSVDADYFSVTKKGVTYNGEKIAIPVMSNTYWAAGLEEGCNWISLDTKGANGDATVNVTISENDSDARTAVITFTSLHAGECRVTVSQASASDPIYYMKDSFSNAPEGEITEDTVQWDVEGIGSAGASWSGFSATVSADMPSSQYEGATGGNNLMLEDGGHMIYGPVSISSANNFLISFGAKATSEGTGSLHVSISQSCIHWAEVASFSGLSGDWRYYMTPFLIADGKESLWLMFEADGGSFRLDDISLDEGDESGDFIMFPEDNIKYVYYPVYEEYFEWLSPSSGATATMPGTDGGNISNEPDMHGLEATYVYRRPGFVKMAATNSAASLTTPKLSALGMESKDIWVSFDAAGYSNDDDAITIAVKGGGLMAVNNESSYTFNIRSSNKWTNFRYEILNASGNTQVTFKSSKSSEEIKSTGLQNRFFLDNIVISWREEVGVDTKPEISADKTSMDIPVDGTAQKLTLNTNYEWSATASEEWIHISPESGDAGSNIIAISADANTEEDRKGSVTFSTMHGKDDVSVTVAVCQKFVKPSLPSPAVRLNYSTWNTLSFIWDRLEDSSSSHKFKFGLYDASGNIVSREWTQTFSDMKYGCAITYSGLEMGSRYTFRITAISNSQDTCDDSDTVEFEASTGGRQIETGTVLAEHFDNFVWGGDYIHGAYGLRAESKEKTMTSNDLSQAEKLVSAGSSTGDVFNTGSFPAAYRNSVLGLEGWTGSKVYMFTGVVKFGTGTSQGWIQTPKLSSITGTKDIEVSFSTCLYQDYGDGKTPDANTIVLSVAGDGTLEQDTFTMNTTFGMEGQKAVIRGATSSTQVKFSASGAKNCRLFLDDIVIREIGDSEVPENRVAAPTDVQLHAIHMTDLAFRWSEPSDNTARKYKVYLYRDPSQEPLYSYTVTYGNKFHIAAFTFAGLDWTTGQTTTWECRAYRQMQTNQILKS
ncbi:MAG: BACON domain-containing protein [Clostridium sp.]|nr:BACON domain-containing protein [Bacteroides sp.]MCM1197846.1 BACON domain-containing protein [Clostridium sp.]